MIFQDKMMIMNLVERYLRLSDRIKEEVMGHRQRAGAVVILLISSVLGGAFWGGGETAGPSRDMANEPAVRDYTKAVQVIEDHYVVTPDKERLTRGALLGMLHVLDPHSNFYDRGDFSRMQDEQSSKFYGIGVTINQRNGKIYVIGVSEDRPAEKAGLKYGDAIVAVNGESAKDWTQSDALKHVRGERGTEVELTIERAGLPDYFTVKITRDEVPYPSIRNVFMIRPETGYIGLTGGFNQETTEELNEAIARLKQEGMTSLVLDLRRNTGGLLKQAVQVAEIFLLRDTEIVSVRGRDGGHKSQVYTSDNAHPEEMPLVIMINNETASASEIVAGAMQDRDRAWIVGEESFGKGLVQTVFRLRGGTGLTLTTGKYYTPSGRSIQRAYKDVSFYNYFNSTRNQNDSQNRGAARKKSVANNSDRDVVYTLSGRRMLSGGGIKPDTTVKTPEENVRLRDACFEFVRNLVAGQLIGFGEYRIRKPEYGYRLKGNEFPLTDQLMAAFREFLRDHRELQIEDAQVNARIDYVRTRIRAELITAAYGMDVAEQFLVEMDSQTMQAIADIPKAKKLNDIARLRNKEK